MADREREVFTVLRMRLPADVALRLPRVYALEGDAAIRMSELIASAKKPGIITAESGATTLQEAVDEDIADVLGSIPPDCPICGEPMDHPHPACEAKALRCLELS